MIEARPGWAPRAGDRLLAALWFALVFGMLEASVLGVRRLVFGDFIWSSRHIAWMTPASYLLFFGLPALGLTLVARVRPRWIPLGWIAGACVAVGMAAMLRLLGEQRIHIAAVWILAVGLGVQVARIVGRGPAVFTRLVRRTLPWLAGGLLAVTAGTEGAWALGERRALARLPAAAAGAPNVLLLILDTVRAAELGLYGYPRPTSPGLERLAARGVVFDWAFATSSWTLPSHGTLFTGRYPHELRADFLVPLDERYPTLAETLRAHGYATAGFVANHNYCSYETGLARGFLHYQDYRVTLRQVLQSSEIGQMLSDWYVNLVLRASDRKPAEEVNRQFLAWLPRAREAGRPFFAFLNYFDAHLPYQAPDSVRRAFAAGHGQVDEYDAAIAHIDAQVTALLDGLARRGVLDNTLVVVTADHGEHLGDHRLWDHGNSLYGQLLHVPLVLSYRRGLPSGVRVGEPVTLRDLPATILAVAGVAPSALPGVSLVGSPEEASTILAELSRRPRAPPSVRNSRGSMYAVIRDRLHYIRNQDGSEELFDYLADPPEARDLARTPNGVARAGEFRRALAAALAGPP